MQIIHSNYLQMKKSTSKKKVAIAIGLGAIVVGGTAILLHKRNKKKKAIANGNALILKDKWTGFESYQALPGSQSGIKSPAFTNVFGASEYLKDYPRGIRNNNPGNIILTSKEWNGEIPKSKNTDGRFKQFYTFSSGVRATILNLKAYFKQGHVTPRKIISKWSPPSENNTASYIAYVSKTLNTSPDTPLSFQKNTIQKLVEAIFFKENGKQYLKQSDFDKAWAAV